MSFLFEELFFSAVDKTAGSKLFKEQFFANIENTDPLYNNRENFYKYLIEQNIIKSGSYFSIILYQGDKFQAGEDVKNKFYNILDDKMKKREISLNTYTKLKQMYNTETNVIGRAATFGGNKYKIKNSKSRRKKTKNTKNNYKQRSTKKHLFIPAKI